MKPELPQKLPTAFVNDVKGIIESGRRAAYTAADKAMVITFWRVGQRIVEEEQGGAKRAPYGKRLIASLAEELRPTYGSSYNKRNLNYFRNFYLCFSDLKIVNELVHNLTWTHFRRLLSVDIPEAREWYALEASRAMWSSSALDRNIQSQFFERRLAAQRDSLDFPKPEKAETDPLEYIKNPVIAEFMGFKPDCHFTESQLEQGLIDNLEKFLLELGRGFAFVDRQKHIATDAGDFYIDLVFYNIQLHAYVLIDLKTNRITHQDVGQMDMYVRMFDELIRGENDNPTIGIVLCSETSKDIARYSVLSDNDHLFAAKYMTVMPTPEELRQEIERQKRFLLEQRKSQ